MPRRYHRAPEFRREHAYVLLFLPACTLVTCVSLALADVYRVPGLARACTVHSCVTREGFRLRVNLQKTRVHGCAHAIRAILNASTMLASIKFKSSCTVDKTAYLLYCTFHRKSTLAGSIPNVLWILCGVNVVFNVVILFYLLLWSACKSQDILRNSPLSLCI